MSVRNFRKRWLLVAIALIIASAGALVWRIRSPGLAKNPPTGKPQLVVQLGHSLKVNTVAFSPDGKTLASGSDDNTIKLWNIQSGKELRTLTEHSSVVNTVAFSPDGRTLASGSGGGNFDDDDTVKLWEIESGKELHTLGRHDSPVRLVSFDPDGQTLISIDGDGTLKIWDVKSGKERRSFRAVTSGFSSVAFSPDNKRLAIESAGHTIKLFEAASGKELLTLTGHSSTVASITFSADGKFLASGSGDETIRLWDTNSGNQLRTFAGHSFLSCVAFSPDGKILASDSKDKTIKLWDIESGSELQELGVHSYYHARVNVIAWSPDGQTLAAGAGDNIGSGDTSIRLWGVKNGKELPALAGHSSGARGNGVALSPDGRTMASGIWDNVSVFLQVVMLGVELPRRRDDYTVKLWDLKGGMEPRILAGSEKINAFAFSPDGKLIAGGSEFRGIRLWDVASGEQLRTLTESASSVANSVAFSPDGKTLAGVSNDSTISFWNVETGTQLRSLRGPPKYNIGPVTFSADGKLIACGGMSHSSFSFQSGLSFVSTDPAERQRSGTIRLWNAEDGREIRTLIGHSMDVEALTFSPDGMRLLSESRDSSLKLWDVSTGREINTFQGQPAPASAIAFSPDGKVLAGGSVGSSVKLWDTATGRELHSLTGHSFVVKSVAFSPDGNTLITGGADAKIRFWDVATGLELASLIILGESDWVVVTPDGRFDTNRDLSNEIEELHWVLPDSPLTTTPVEVFMRDYYEPRLLERVLAREKLKPVRDFTTLNRTRPDVKIVDIAPDSTETVQVTVQVTNVRSESQTSAFGSALQSGVYDLRLFRDGQLVGYAPANDDESALSFFASKAMFKFPHIKWPRTGDEEVAFSAYAFNSDRIKSKTDRKDFKLIPLPPPVKGRAYVISLGVNAYERETLNLRYAANDAREMQRSLAGRLAVQGEYEEVVSLPLVSDYELALNDGRTVAAQDATAPEVQEGQKRVTENGATKAHLRAVLDVLAGRQADPALLKGIANADKLRAARPEDLILLSVSSHGYTDSDGIFYIVPSDTGTAALSSSDFRSHCISSDELSHWLRDVDAGELVMIVDACHSSAAVEGTDFKPGPMGSRGLGQLSYDKGMRILTATQADNVAMETNKVRQGLLTYALLNDGFAAGRADYKPQDNQITLTEWLGYGVERVPHLYEEVKAGAMQVSDTGTNLNRTARIIRDTVDTRESDNDKTQQPSLFDFARRRRDVVLVDQR